MARTVVFDFDGVIHSYTSGWKGETNIPDTPVPGIQEALKEIHDAGYEVVVVSARCKTVLGRMAIENWLDMYGMTQEVDKVCKEKPPAIAYIDDRAICFDGHPETLLKKIQNFQPWYKKPTLTPPNEPLTIEQLREMDGEPVWIVDIGPHKWYGPGWAIVERDNCLVRTAKNWSPVFFERYGEQWLAYRRPPEGEEDA